MFIPLAEVETEYREGGEERNAFYFYKRDPHLPVEVKITRLPPLFDPAHNWHRHKFVQEFSVPLTGKIVIKEEIDGKIKEKILKEAILTKDEWVVGVECKSTKRIGLLVEGKNGKRRSIKIEFYEQFTEGKNWHTVGNQTKELVTMITLKRTSRSMFRKDSMIFKIDRETKLLQDNN
jgi:hypothetical protein